MARILIVDDERLLVKGLRRSLEGAGYEVVEAYDGIEALKALARVRVDLVVLDIMLPGIDGLEVCRRIRQTSDVPIIMLTARGDDIDRIVGLELGADDYLPKPFNTRELIARIRAVLRRVSPAGTRGLEPQSQAPFQGHIHGPIFGGLMGDPSPEEVIRAAGLEIDVPRQQVRVEGRTVELTVREFELLYTLARHPERVFTREILLERIWGANYYGDPRVVDVYVRRLRQKIEPDPAHPRFIITRWGSGYYFSGGGKANASPSPSRP